MPLNSSWAWSRFFGCVAFLSVVAGCSAPSSPPIATSPTPAVSSSPKASESPTPIAAPQATPVNPEPEKPTQSPSEASRKVERCVVRMAKVNDPEAPLNVRSSPNATSKENIVGKLSNGVFVDVKDEQNGWFRIESEISGWIAKSKTESNCGEKTERVEFASGDDTVQIRDRFIGVGTHKYRLNLAKGQKLTVTRDQGGVFPAIVMPSGKYLVESPERDRAWTGELAETGDYAFIVESNYKGYEYAFSVTAR